MSDEKRYIVLGDLRLECLEPYAHAPITILPMAPVCGPLSPGAIMAGAMAGAIAGALS